MTRLPRRKIISALPTAVNGLPSAVALNGTLRPMGRMPISWIIMAWRFLPVRPSPLRWCSSFRLRWLLTWASSTPTETSLPATTTQSICPRRSRCSSASPPIDPASIALRLPPPATPILPSPAESAVGDVPYLLTIQNTGDLAVGGIVATNNILDNVDPLKPEASFGVQTGDLGGLSAGGAIMSSNPGNTVVALTGNIRDIIGGTIGLNAPTNLDPEIQAPHGSVGLWNPPPAFSSSTIRCWASRRPWRRLSRSSARPHYTPSSSPTVASASSAPSRCRTLLAGRSTASGPGGQRWEKHHSWKHRPDRHAGRLGEPSRRRTEIITGPQGNVGYIRVGGTVYRDATFGGGEPKATLYQPGESVTLTDDSVDRLSSPPPAHPPFRQPADPPPEPAEASSIPIRHKPPPSPPMASKAVAAWQSAMSPRPAASPSPEQARKPVKPSRSA